MGGSVQLDIIYGYFFLYNNELLIVCVVIYVCEYMGEENVVDFFICMISEDFFYYFQEIFVCFYCLGMGNVEWGIIFLVYINIFDVDECSLLYGVGLMVWLGV